MGNRRWGWAFGLGLGVAIAPIVPSQAQITPDGSLGNEGSLTTPTETGVQIDGGALRGDNLFHSFQEFSIPTNSEAFFNNPDVANIFSRVTGGSISDIDGLLRANGTANLFLLNPNGIIFGPNARLDIGGSFVASTANSLVFENGLAFNAGESGEAPLLSVNVPLGVQFNDNPGSIEATGATLNVSEGGAIALVGGEISLNDVEINAPAGRIDLVGVGEAGQVSFETSGVNSGFPSGGFGVPADLSRASVSLDGTTFDVTGLVGGEIGIQALDVEMRDSFLRGGIAEGLGIEGGQSGNIELDTTGNITISDDGIANLVREGSIGNAGDIILSADNIELNNGAQLDSSTLGEGDAGSVTLRVSNSIILSGSNSEDFPSAILNRITETGKGDGGNITLIGEVIEISEGALLSSSTFGEGNAGNVTIEASDTVHFLNGNIFTSVEETGRGNAGNIRVIGSRVEVQDGAQLISNTLGQGNAGRININGAETIIFSGEDSEGFVSGAFSSVGETGQGNASEIHLFGNHIEVSNRAELSSSTFGEGDAGNVTIEASDTVFLLNGNVFSEVTETGMGNGGNVRVIGNRVEVQDGAQLISNTLGQGDAGRIDIYGTEAIIFSGENSEGFSSGALSNVRETGRGNAGEVTLRSNYVEVSNGAQLSSSTLGEGNAGNVTIEASDTARFLNGDIFSAVGETGLGNGGNISIIGNRVEVQDGAQLISDTSGQGNAGQIDINGAEAIIFSGENLDGFSTGAFSNVVDTGQGNAGKINLIGGYVDISNGARLSSSIFGEGNAGNITIEASDTVRLSNANVFSSVEETGRGNAGNIRVIGNRVEVQDGAQLISNTLGQGNAGRIDIHGTEAIIFSGQNSEGSSSGAFSRITETGQGDAGEINLTGNHVEVSNRAQLSSSTFGEGDAGNVTIEASNTVRFLNGDILSTVAETGQGDGGNISVTGNRVEVQDGAQLISDTSGQGHAGRININGTEAIIFSGENSEGFSSGALSNVRGTGRGNAGEVNLLSRYIEVSDRAQLSSSTFGEGDAGNVTIEASDTARFLNGDIFTSVEETGRGNGGNISVTGNRVEVQDGAQLISDTSGQGHAGRININGAEAIVFSGENSEGFSSGAFSAVRGTGRGNAGEVNLRGNDVEVINGAELSSSTFGEGDAGNVTIEASDTARFLNGNVLSAVTETGLGNGGNISVTGNRVEVQDGAQLISDTSGQGNAGRININGAEAIIFSGGNLEGLPSGASIQIREAGQGDAGEISLLSNYVEVSNGAELSSSTFGEGDAGNITIEASNTARFSNVNVFSAVAETGLGNGGNISVTGNRVEVQDGAQLISNTSGQGHAGRININGAEAIIFSGANSEGFSSGAFSNVRGMGRGNAGEIRLLSNFVQVSDQAQLSSSTFGEGNAGNVTIEASNTAQFLNGNIFSSVGETGRGNGGNIRIIGNRVEVRDGAILSSNTFGEGNAGRIDIHGSEAMIFSGENSEGSLSGAFSNVLETGQGNAGEINLIGNYLEVSDQAGLSSSTFGDGNAGTVSIEVGDTFLLSDGLVASGVGETGRGNAGNVTVVADQLEVYDGFLSSSSFSQGNAGTVTIEVHDTAIFSSLEPNRRRSGLYSTVEETGQGNAGGVTLIAGTVELRDGARLSSSNNATSNANDFAAGDVFVQADRLHLSDRADISANTGGRGGNVRLDTGTTVLRRGSTIQTNAEGDFPGGNIIIDADALVALENSDITANALNAAGGRVIINSQGIFGTEFRDELTPQSDITATSDLGAEFSGSVELNTPEVDTATGLVDLAANPIDVAALLDTDPCTLGRESEFYVTGRGGLPPNPDGSLATETTWVDWRSLEDNPSETAMVRDEETAPLVEAQGWHINGEGSVVLSAETPDGSPTPPQGRPAHCSPEQLNR